MAAIVSRTRTMPKRKSLAIAYYSQLTKRRFSGVDSMHSHVDSPWVSLDRALDAFAHVDSLRVSVDATSRKESESSGCNSSGTYSNPFRICLHQFSIDSVTRYNESSDSASNFSDKESEPVSQQDSEPVSQLDSELVSQLDSELVSQQESETTRLGEDTIQVKACQALEKIKQLSDGASKHITITKVMYKPMEDILLLLRVL